jgi:hypothetical protein
MTSAVVRKASGATTDSIPRVVEGITRTLLNVLGKRPEHIHIIIDEVDPGTELRPDAHDRVPQVAGRDGLSGVGVRALTARLPEIMYS